MKGVLLAGGTGSRLYPLTRITNKHLLPIFDRPMIAWAIEALVNAGIDEIMLVTGGTHAGEFLRLTRACRLGRGGRGPARGNRRRDHHHRAEAQKREPLARSINTGAVTFADPNFWRGQLCPCRGER